MTNIYKAWLQKKQVSVSQWASVCMAEFPSDISCGIPCIIETAAHEVNKRMTAQINQYIKLRIKDKPRFMPNRLYKTLLKRLVVMEYF